MDRCVAHGARLVLGGLVMRRSRGPLSGECVTLQAQQIHLAHAQETRIRGAMGRVTTAAAFGFHRYMLIDEWALLIGVALCTDRVSAGQGPHLLECGCAMSVMTVAALDQAFVHAMVIRLREVRLRAGMTSVAQAGLCTNEEMLRFFGVMRRVAIQAPNIVARVCRCREVPLLMFCRVATQATGIGILLRHRLEANDLGHIPAAFYVGGSGTVAGLTTMSVVQRCLEMRCVLEVLFVEIFMTGLARVRSNILAGSFLGGLFLGGSAGLFLGCSVDGRKHAG